MVLAEPKAQSRLRASSDETSVCKASGGEWLEGGRKIDLFSRRTKIGRIPFTTIDCTLCLNTYAGLCSCFVQTTQAGRSGNVGSRRSDDVAARLGLNSVLLGFTLVSLPNIGVGISNYNSPYTGYIAVLLCSHPVQSANQDELCFPNSESCAAN